MSTYDVISKLQFTDNEHVQMIEYTINIYMEWKVLKLWCWKEENNDKRLYRSVEKNREKGILVMCVASVVNYTKMSISELLKNLKTCLN